MLTHEERICLIRKRTIEIKMQKIKTKQHILDFCCFAACMLLIAGIGTFMPDFTGSVIHISGAASLVADNVALGYILMGLLAFLLGVSVTVLLFRLRHRRERIKQEEEDNEF